MCENLNTYYEKDTSILMTVQAAGLYTFLLSVGAVPLLAPLVVSPEPRLRRNACCALAQVAKHSVDLAEVVVEADLFPRVLTCLKFPDDGVRKYGATAVREVGR